ncbi:transcriptional regulator, LacI family [Promicromonospora umidemergens]|uniref:LacI family DNA-binding transcriptional regulator n=1 Tax=Promicromonospora umidemergens TaxID=629679 RepID=A0ABP8WXY9_9MICO|nr:LacI family DNA-binding transcriptional regulator [Promicromonospora umidemergens]MCP2285523.1 transcriptional regulator, LacI family [Promicromonospora umidemergens]
MARDTVTLRDVADAAGVSIATASRALTGKNRVSKATTAHVSRVAERLGYRVNVFGRALREGTDGAVGVIVPVISNPFYGQLVHSLEEQLREHSLELIIADSHGDVARERERLRMLVQRRVEGIVIVPSDASASLDAVAEAADDVPLVQLDRRVEEAPTDFVGVDNERGIALLVNHLGERGATEIVLVASDDTTSAGRERRAAFDREIARRGLPVLEPILDRFTLEFGLSAAGTIARSRPLPDAIVAGDDLIATGLITGLKRHGVVVPRDVMVTGFDGTMLADICDPALTTVVQPFDQIAAEAVRALLRRTKQRDAPAIYSRLAPALRESMSTARPLAPPDTPAPAGDDAQAS